MEGSERKDLDTKNIKEIATYSVPFSLKEQKEDLVITSSLNDSEKSIINMAINFHLKGDLSKATKYYQ